MGYAKELVKKLNSLSVFRKLKQDEVFHAFEQCIYHYAYVPEKKEEFHAKFCSALYEIGHTDNWTEYLKNKILSLESPCVYFVAKKQEIPKYIEKSARNDLEILTEIASVTPEMLFEDEHIISYWDDFEIEHILMADYPPDDAPDDIPKWRADYLVNLQEIYFKWLANIHKHGYGDYAIYNMFHMQLDHHVENGFVLKPVKYPDSVQLHDLIGYEWQRNQVIENTKALLNGLKASNILLYGDAGTGKSATVKAVANAFADDGLRLIELSKNELHLLPKLLEELSENPLKFILFIDDLSFQENDDDFSALKAVLEGSISARLHNTVIYATSNRRHIVRETFSQRDGDEIHKNDTIQETISLSERFGIQILYDKPNKNLYLEIVNQLAKQYELELDSNTLGIEAERFALRKSGRSARSARQLIEQLYAKQKGDF
ncbi:MAG: ATP-binding protein [Oscillospiraceae bacterium]|nr:ATP-binding protein [Oscillospiraceae bacterium]